MFLHLFIHSANMLSILCFILKVLEFGVKMIDIAIASSVFAAFSHPTDQMSGNRYNRFPRRGMLGS